MIWLVLLLLALAASAFAAAMGARACASATPEKCAPAVVRPGWRVRPDILVARDDTDGCKISSALGVALVTVRVCDAGVSQGAKRRPSSRNAMAPFWSAGLSPRQVRAASKIFTLKTLAG